MSDEHPHVHGHAPERPPRRKGMAARAALALVDFYRLGISPLKPYPTCRFTPSCSSYTAEAIAVHGAFKGLALGTWRLLKCGPWHPGGYDPVPPRSADRSALQPEM